MSDDPIGDVIRKQLRERMDGMMMDAIFGAPIYTNTAPVEREAVLDLDKMLKHWEQMLRNWKREQITFVVDIAHPGPIISHETPTEGTRVEMSWLQAQALHRLWPIKLSQVLSPEQAEFVPIGGIFPEFVPRDLQPAPPWSVDENGA